jgi:RNA polymerase sigma factor (sigma-70 family)
LLEKKPCEDRSAGNDSLRMGGESGSRHKVPLRKLLERIARGLVNDKVAHVQYEVAADTEAPSQTANGVATGTPASHAALEANQLQAPLHAGAALIRATQASPSAVVPMLARQNASGLAQRFDLLLAQLTFDERLYLTRIAERLSGEAGLQWRNRVVAECSERLTADPRDVIMRELAYQRIDQFLRSNLGRVRMFAARTVGAIDADDVVQEASLDLQQYILKLPWPSSASPLASDASLRSLIFRITSCRVYDALRKKKRAKEQLTAEGAVMDRADDRSMRRSEAALDVDRLQHCYTIMPPIQRIVHVLHHYHEFTARECATMLGLTVSNVETLISRATEMLKNATEIEP